MVHLLDNLMTVGLGLLELGGLVALVALIRRRMPDLQTIGIAFAILLVGHVALFVGLFIQPPALRYNWVGKVLSIAVTLAAIALLRSLTWRDAGFTWNQHKALGQALIATACICAFAWSTDVLLAGFHPHLPAIRGLLYEATLPGLNEEPLYRGIALVLLDRAFANERIRILGAPIGWGAVITAVWFGLIHGSGFAGGHVQIDPVTIGVVAVIGCGLAWIRMRTQSLAVCVLAHNAVNVGLQVL